MIQMNTLRLHGAFSVHKADGSNITVDDKVSVINNAPQTLFRQIELMLNGVCVNDLSTSTYHYKAFIENHYSFDKDIKETTLSACEMYERDVPTLNSDPETANVKDAKTNGFLKRKERILNGNQVHFILLIHLDFLQNKKYLIPNVEMKFRFIRNEDHFTVFCKTASPKITMHYLELRVRKITCDPVAVAGIEKALATTPAKYHVPHAKIKTFLLNNATQSQNISQIYRGKLPRSFHMLMVPSKGFDCDKAVNPFRFRHFDLSGFNAFINGEPIHPKAITPDWSTEACLEQYMWHLQNIGLHMNASNGISFEDFRDHSVMFSYDRTPDLCNSSVNHGIDTGTIDVSVAFKAPLAENVTLIFYGVFDECVTIDKDRNVVIVQ